MRDVTKVIKRKHKRVEKRRWDFYLNENDADIYRILSLAHIQLFFLHSPSFILLSLSASLYSYYLRNTYSMHRPLKFTFIG